MPRRGFAGLATRRCPHCGIEKELDGFGLRQRSPSGRKSWCRACEAARQKARARERQAAGLCVECGRPTGRAGRPLCAPCLLARAGRRAARRASGLCVGCGSRAETGRTRCRACLDAGWVSGLAGHGLAEGDYLRLLHAQGEGCAICRTPCGTGRRLAVDHDHRTGRVRGLLCFRCNTSLARYEQYTAEFAAYLGGVTIGTATP